MWWSHRTNERTNERRASVLAAHPQKRWLLIPAYDPGHLFVYPRLVAFSLHRVCTSHILHYCRLHGSSLPLMHHVEHVGCRLILDAFGFHFDHYSHKSFQSPRSSSTFVIQPNHVYKLLLVRHAPVLFPSGPKPPQTSTRCFNVAFKGPFSQTTNARCLLCQSSWPLISTSNRHMIRAAISRISEYAKFFPTQSRVP